MLNPITELQAFLRAALVEDWCVDETRIDGATHFVSGSSVSTLRHDLRLYDWFIAERLIKVYYQDEP